MHVSRQHDATLAPASCILHALGLVEQEQVAALLPARAHKLAPEQQPDQRLVELLHVQNPALLLVNVRHIHHHPPQVLRRQRLRLEQLRQPVRGADANVDSVPSSAPLARPPGLHPTHVPGLLEMGYLIGQLEVLGKQLGYTGLLDPLLRQARLERPAHVGSADARCSDNDRVR